MKRLFLILCFAACALSVIAQTPGEVPKDHWAYNAIIDLANKGYVNGYPDAKFIGDRTMSRYEFATIIKRILDNLETRKGKTNESTTDSEYAAVPQEISSPEGVSSDDLDTIKKLVDEFKVELTVIGTRVNNVDTDLAELKNTVDNVNSIVTDPEGPFESARADIAKMKKISFSGYLQTRYQMLQNPEDKKALHTDDTFRVRRARLKVTARPSDKSMAVIQIDAGDNKLSTKEAYLQYNSATDQLLGPSYLVGQQLWYFGYDVTNSSSKRETPEEALFVRRFFPGDYDRGAVVTSPIKKNWFGTIGVYDGSGTDTVNQLYKDFNGTNQKVSSTVSRDYNSPKDLLLNVKYSNPTTEFGFSGYMGKGIWNKDRTAMDSKTDKIRYGADFRYYMDRVTFKTEYIRAKGIDQTDTTKFNPDKWVDGYYGQVDLSVTNSDMLVARYENLSQDPLYPSFGRRTAWNLGYIKLIDDAQKFKLFYQINTEEKNAINNNAFIAEWLVTY